MTPILLYLLKVNGLLVVFYFIYQFFLAKETFFQANRWYFIFGILISFTFPLLSYSKIVWVEPELITTISSNESLSETAVNMVVENVAAELKWNYVTFLLYAIVTLALLIKLTVEIFSFLSIIKKGNKQKKLNIIWIENQSIDSPFSFFNYLVYNPHHFSEEELHTIFIHEKVHIAEQHTIDVLLSKLLTITFWINPFVWEYRKAMLQNLEFIADSKTTQQTNSTNAYQKILLKSAINQQQLSITNQFYQSLIKKRIVMLNKKSSNIKNVWKYATVLPILLVFFMAFQVKTIAQTKVNDYTTIATIDRVALEIDKNSTNEEIENEKKFFKEKGNLTLKINTINRNTKGEIIEIDLTLLSSNSKKDYTIKSSNPIEPFVVYFEKNENQFDFGFLPVKTATYFPQKNTITQDGWSVFSIKTDGLETILIINGKLQNDDEPIIIPNNESFDSFTEISFIEAKTKYGATDSTKKYKVLNTKSNPSEEIVIGKFEDDTEQQTNEVDVAYGITYETHSPENTIEKIKENKSINYKKAFIQLNGKKISANELEKIDSNTIASSIELTPSTSVIKQYGEKAKHGVIILETFDYVSSKTGTLDEGIDGADFKLNETNESFVISKNSTTEDLDFYKSIFAKSGYKMIYSNIKKNSKNEITAIKLKLTKKGTNLNKEVNQKNPIKDIRIGFKNGKAFIE